MVGQSHDPKLLIQILKNNWSVKEFGGKYLVKNKKNAGD